MRCITLFALLFAISLTAQDKKKWDVNDPDTYSGSNKANYKEITFTTTEGTWICLDVAPDGQTIVFDLLGDIYTMPVSGGNATCIRSGLAWEVQPRFSPDGTRILFTSDAGGGDNIWMMQANGSDAKQITKETFRLLNNAEWIDNEYIVGRKHFTSGRSLGAGELWMYHISGGEGVQLTKRKNDQQDVNEPSVSSDGRYIYFSEDMYGGGYFQYNKDPNTQIFAVRRYDRQEGKIEEIAGGSGGACRPQISPDGYWLAFVRRVGVKSVLCLQELSTGNVFPVYDGLDKDQQEAWTIFGCYPGFSWMPDGKAMIISYGGKIKKVDLNVIPDPETDDGIPHIVTSDIPFSCTVKTKIADTQRTKQPVFQEQFESKAIRQALTSPDGKLLVFNSNGKLYKRTLPDGVPELLITKAYSIKQSGAKQVDDLTFFEFDPAFSSDGQQIVFSVWNDIVGGGIWRINLKTNTLTQVNSKNGIYRTPAFSPDGNTIVFLTENGDDELGGPKRAKTGIFSINLAEKPKQGNNIEEYFITDTGENPRFSPDGKRIYVTTGGYLFGGLDKSLRSFDLNGKDEKILAKSKYANQWVPSPDGKWLAFTELHKAYICAMPMPGQALDISGGMTAVPVATVSRDAGYNLHWSADAKQLHYTLGNEYFTIDLNKRFSFLPGAPDSLPALETTGLKIGLTFKSDKPDGKIIFYNARIITCEGDQVIEKGELEVTDNKITYLGPNRRITASKSDQGRFDCKGKTIMPGMIDAHAHSGNFRYGMSPQKQWEYYANLAYGVTTMHDPSANSEMVFSHSEMLKSGRMIGPRLFSTGTILYGAEGDFKATVNSLDDARAALRRTQAWGAFSVKSYNQPRREQRQQIMTAARELGIQVVPEGGSFFAHNMTQIIDGHTTIEHNIPVAPLYNDVITLWSKTKTHNTPTLIVNYAGMTGEYYWYQNTDVWTKKRLLHFTPGHIIMERSRHVTKIPDEEYQNGHILTSKSCKKLQDAGVNINLGSHGQLQGLGAHWELWMLQQGGMSNMQALRCATINGAKSMGMDAEIGSLVVGKLADLIVLDANPLDDIKNSESIRYVMVNGRLYDAGTMNEIGNHETKRTPFWFEMPGSQMSIPGGGHSCTQERCVCGH